MSKSVRVLIKLGVGLGGLALIGTMVLVAANVIARAFNSGITFTHELIVLLMVITVAFAIAYAGLEKAHITVGVVTSRLKNRTLRAFEIAGLIISLVVTGLFIWGGILIVVERWIGYEESALLGISYVPFRAALVLGFVLLLLTIVGRLVFKSEGAPEE